MNYYPVFLDLKGKDCLVVGGGTLALHKTKALLRSGAHVTVVSPEILPALSVLKGISIRQKEFEAKDLEENGKVPWLVISATDDEQVNQQVSKECRSRRIWGNVVDRKSLCDFILPAVESLGDIVFAISTGGTSPALAKFLKQKIKAVFGPEYQTLAEILKEIRPTLLEIPFEERKNFLRQNLNEKSIKKVKEGNSLALKEQWLQDIQNIKGKTLG